MSRVLKRESAKRDLVQQWLWYAEQAGVEIADGFLEAAEKTLKMLATHPDAGTAFVSRKPGLQGIRRFPISDGFEKILLFYLPLQGGVDLVRVVHGSRDVEQLLHNDFEST